MAEIYRISPGRQRSRISLRRYHLGRQRSDGSLGSPMSPRCRRYTGDQLHHQLGERISLGNHATSSRRKSRNLDLGKAPYPRDTEIYPMDTEVSIEDQEVSRAQEIRKPRRSETWQFRDRNSRKSEEAETSEEPWDPG